MIPPQRETFVLTQTFSVKLSDCICVSLNVIHIQLITVCYCNIYKMQDCNNLLKNFL